MRQLTTRNLKQTSVPLGFDRYKKQAELKRIDHALELALLGEIRNGNRDAIPKLVNSQEHLIINVIEHVVHNWDVPIEKMIAAGKAALTTLAERELGSANKERFLGDGLWWIRQAILKMATEAGILSQ